MGQVLFSPGGGGGAGSDDCTATSAQVLPGYTAIVNGSDDEPVNGTMSTKTAATYNTSTSDQTISAGQYLSGAQTIKAVTTSNIDAGNIKKGVAVTVGDANSAGRIKNVTGTYTTVSSGQSAVVAGAMLSGYSGFANGGAEVKGSITSYSDSGNATLNGSTTSKSYPAGYYPNAHGATHTTVNIPDPSISVSSSGLITASASWTAGFTTDTSYSATKQLTTYTDSGNTTLTGSTTSKSFAAGYYPNAHGAAVSTYEPTTTSY